MFIQQGKPFVGEVGGRVESEAWDVGAICFSNLSWAPECKPLIFGTNNNDSNNQIKKERRKKKKKSRERKRRRKRENDIEN